MNIVHCSRSNTSAFNVEYLRQERSSSETRIYQFVNLDTDER